MIVERTTNAIAAGAAASPWWLPKLADISQTAALLLPIAGLLWLVIQIVTKITERRSK